MQPALLLQRKENGLVRKMRRARQRSTLAKRCADGASYVGACAVKEGRLRRETIGFPLYVTARGCGRLAVRQVSSPRGAAGC